MILKLYINDVRLLGEILSGIGIFQIGDQIVEVDANKDPTLIIIPGNTPHQILNEKDEPLMFFYYFPGFHSFI